jgi:hypothetical protein
MLFIMETTPLHSPNRSQLRRGRFLIVLGRRLALLVFLLGAALLAQPCAATSFGVWEYTGSLNTARMWYTATLLSDGNVLVAGGLNTHIGYLASAELYDASTGTWTITGSLNEARDSDTATLLSDGKVLVAGGYYCEPNNPCVDLASAELYDPTTGTWTLTGSLNIGRSGHTATLLPDGRVLVAAGSGLASAELYDPATGTWTVTGSLNTGCSFHTATLLPDGKVLVAGGENNYIAQASAELYDPATGTWTLASSLNTAREAHTATLLSDGKVLVAGGFTSTSELYDPATGAWTYTGSLNTARSGHTATLLLNDEVLVAAGNDLASAELYDPATGTWTVTGSLNTVRDSNSAFEPAHTATLLPNGNVLAAGGYSSSTRGNMLASAELYDPSIAAATTVQGRGDFDNQGNEVPFNFRATLADDSITLGYFSFCDSIAGVCITRGKIQSLSFAGNTADFSGRDDASRVTFSVSVTDNGDPGTLDRIVIKLSNGYSVSGRLTSGDIRIY